jgi:hypothetical protein
MVGIFQVPVDKTLENQALAACLNEHEACLIQAQNGPHLTQAQTQNANAQPRRKPKSFPL